MQVTLIVRKTLNALLGEWTDHNHCSRHNRRNIFCTKGGKRRTAKGVTCICGVGMLVALAHVI